MKRLLILAVTLLTMASCNNNIQEKSGSKINLRLKWAYQSQFAGFLIAKEKGFYQEEGLDVQIRPAGPDLKPYSTVASGSDDIGIGIITQIVTSRSNNVPVVAFAQIFQDSPNRFVLKKRNQINKLQDLKGKKVGLWMGGDEIEFIAMLKTAGMTMDDIQVVPQKFSILPFLQDEYVCSQVMTYNELNQIRTQGFPADSLQIISPEQYNSAVLGDLLFTNESFLKNNPEKLQKFLAASFKGWKYAESHPGETINIVMKYNPELKKEEQVKQLESVLQLIQAEKGKGKGMGYIDQKNYQNAKQILLGGLRKEDAEYNKIEKVDIQSCYTDALVKKLIP